MYQLLDRIDSPKDIKELSIAELQQLCDEVRSFIIECCSTNPGHLASSLGAVELIIGWHYVFDAPEDKLVFDVGHQAYAHKIITGRREAFRTARTANGISGFPRLDESPYDAFGAGHSSTSISAALGLAEAERHQGRRNKVVALIGDGAFTGGLAFEGMNNAGYGNADLLVILNDNDHSIDDNRGALRNYLVKVTTSHRYNKVKNRVWNLIGEGHFRKSVQNWLKSLKSWIVKSSGGDLFEALGFRYFGPIDGNNIETVVQTLKKIKDMEGPRLLHCFTIKGKGYSPAESDPTTWHAPGKFNPETGERMSSSIGADRYQDVFGEVLCDLASKDRRIVGITPAMASGCGMNKLAERMPDRFYDVGIAEEHAVTFSAGLAAGGMIPFCNIYSSFSQRAYDQIIHDVALQRQKVILCFDRAGLVGEDGATHQGLYDMAAYRSIPEIIISSPRNELELKNMMYSALEGEQAPYIIRYPRGRAEGVDWKNRDYSVLKPGQGEVLKEGSVLAVIGIGPVVNRALEAAESFDGKIGVYDIRYLKPIDLNLLDEVAGKYDHIFTIEDGSIIGGLHSAVSEYMSAYHPGIGVSGIGVADKFIHHASQSEQRMECGLDTESIKKSFEKYLQNRK